ncbi:MAG: hypothetical protein ABIZ91_18965 [Gemmatimonadaceae bacterium]
MREFAGVAEAYTALAEHDAAERDESRDGETKSVSRSATLRAIGVGIGRLGRIAGRDHPRLGVPERKSLVTFMEWLGQQLVRVAGA